jgi:DNA-directed RNA polymerase specialized sigma24 family protein
MERTQQFNWEEGYQKMYPKAKQLVYQLRVPSWKGQEEDVAWDIVQECMRKAFEYIEKGNPVQSLPALLNMIVRNYCIDLYRRDKRLLHEEDGQIASSFVDNEDSFREEALENAYREGIFCELAHHIAAFPKKTRQALLSDLAGMMNFEEKPSSLQAAFRAEGIYLEEYRFATRSQNERERIRTAALLNYAYKRLRELKGLEKLWA